MEKKWFFIIGGVVVLIILAIFAYPYLYKAYVHTFLVVDKEIGVPIRLVKVPDSQPLPTRIAFPDIKYVNDLTQESFSGAASQQISGLLPPDNAENSLRELAYVDSTKGYLIKFATNQDISELEAKHFEMLLQDASSKFLNFHYQSTYGLLEVENNNSQIQVKYMKYDLYPNLLTGPPDAYKTRVWIQTRAR